MKKNCVSKCQFLVGTYIHIQKIYRYVQTEVLYLSFKTFSHVSGIIIQNSLVYKRIAGIQIVFLEDGIS